MTTRMTRRTTTKRRMDKDKEYNGLQCNTQQSNRKNGGRVRTRMDDKTRRMTDDKEDDGHENNR